MSFCSRLRGRILRTCQLFLWRCLLWFYLRQKTYQPIWYGAKKNHDKRDMEARWRMMAAALTEEDATALDLGCSEGYLSWRLSQQGCLTLGVDLSPFKIDVARIQASLGQVPNLAFMTAVIDQKFIEKLPSFDVVFFLSVFHHVVKNQGIDGATDIIKALRKKTRRVMIFEMGQSNETLHSWAKLLPDMGEDPHAWIAQYLTHTGFSRVVKLGETIPSSRYRQSPIKRAVFAAYV